MIGCRYTIGVDGDLLPQLYSHCRVVSQAVENFNPDPANYMQAADTSSELLALRYLAAVIQSHLDKFAEGTSLEGDEALLNGSEISDDMRTVVTYRFMQRGVSS